MSESGPAVLLLEQSETQVLGNSVNISGTDDEVKVRLPKHCSSCESALIQNHAQLHRNRGQFRDTPLSLIGFRSPEVAAAATKANADPQVGCSLNPLTTGFTTMTLSSGPDRARPIGQQYGENCHSVQSTD